MDQAGQPNKANPKSASHSRIHPDAALMKSKPDGSRVVSSVELNALFEMLATFSPKVRRVFEFLLPPSFPLRKASRVYANFLAAVEKLCNLGTNISMDTDEYKELWELAQVEPDPEVKDPISVALTREAFADLFLNVKGLEFLIEHCSRQLYEWSQPGSPYYSMFTAILNGSLSGKSRMIIEFCRQRALLFYINVSASDDVSPEPSTTIRDWILDNCDPSMSDADLKMQSFILACAAKLLEWLKSFQAFNDQTEVFHAWYEEQGIGESNSTKHTAFWESVLLHQKRIAFDLTVHSRRVAIGLLGLKKNYSDAAQEFLQVLGESGIAPTKFPAELEGSMSEAQWNSTSLGSPLFDGALLNEYALRIKLATKDIDDLLWANGKATQYAEFRDNLLKEWGVKNHKWPTWYIAIDESRSLLTTSIQTANGVNENIFQVFRHACRLFPTEGPGVVAMVTDTCSRISNFAPSGKVPPSARSYHILSNRPGRQLFSPFVDIQSFDVEQYHPESMKDIITLHGYSKFGRAALWAYRKRSGNGEYLMGMLRRKLEAQSDNPEITDASSVAILSFLICISVQAYTPLAQELVASFMMKCIGISQNRHEVYIRGVPEPAFGMVARSLIYGNWGPILQRLCQRGITDINLGANGEVASQLLIMMAAMEAEKKGVTASFAQAPEFRDDFPILPISVFDFLHHLGMRENFMHPNDWNMIQEWKSKLVRSYIRLVQFTKSYADFTPEYLKGRFCRANGIMCMPQYAGIDGLLPMFVAEKPFESVEAMKNTKLVENAFSHVGLQFKNHSDFKGMGSYREFASDMEADFVLGAGAGARNEALFYVSLLLDVGPWPKRQRRSKNKLNVSVFEGDDGRQLTVAIRGLRPSDILGESIELDEKFDIIRRGPVDPVDSVRRKITFSQSDSYGQDRSEILNPAREKKLSTRGETAQKQLESMACSNEFPLLKDDIQKAIDAFGNLTLEPSNQAEYFLAVRKMEKLISKTDGRKKKRSDGVA